MEENSVGFCPITERFLFGCRRFREELDELEMLASECYIQGIHPILKLSLSYQSLEYIAENKAPEKIEPKHLLALMEGLDAWISIFRMGKKERKEENVSA